MKSRYVPYMLLFTERIKFKVALCLLLLALVFGVFSLRTINNINNAILSLSEDLTKSKTAILDKEKVITNVLTEAVTVKDEYDSLLKQHDYITNEHTALLKVKAEYEIELEAAQCLIDALSLESNNIVINKNNLRVLSNATENQLNELLNGTALENHGWVFLEAEHKHQVNAIWVISIINAESSLGASNLAKTKNNLAGITGGDGFRTFDSLQDCIYYVFSLLDQQYLSEDGKFYHGVGIADVNMSYARYKDGTINWEWSPSVTNSAVYFVKSLTD